MKVNERKSSECIKSGGETWRVNLKQKAGSWRTGGKPGSDCKSEKAGNLRARCKRKAGWEVCREHVSEQAA